MQKKRCGHCKKIKSIENFFPSKQTPDKYFSWCKTCSREKHREVRLKRSQQGLCIICGLRPPKSGLKSCSVCRKQHRRKYGVKKKLLYHQFKKEVFQHYGNKCACCGEATEQFLTIDHIKGDGSIHRRQTKRMWICRWLVENNYPKGFQLLCWNCNIGKFHNNNICPHKEKEMV